MLQGEQWPSTKSRINHRKPKRIPTKSELGWKKDAKNTIIFIVIHSYSILNYIIQYYTILFYHILSYSIMFCHILSHSIIFYPVLCLLPWLWLPNKTPPYPSCLHGLFLNSVKWRLGSRWRISLGLFLLLC